MHRALLIAALLITAAPSAAQAPAGAPSSPAARPGPTPPRAAAVQPIPRQTYIGTMDADFRKIDADKNGRLTRAEIDGYQRAVSILQVQRRNRAMFTRLDTDRNGQISPQEFAALQSAPSNTGAAPILAEVDLNRDQIVTLIEYRTGKLVKFDRMDTDKDSVISLSEMRAAGVIK